MQNKKQLIELMNHYADKRDLKNGRKIAQKLLRLTCERLQELSHIDIDASNYRDVMDEIDRIGNSTKVSI